MAGHGSQSLGLGFYQLIKCTSLQSAESPICVECQTWFKNGLGLSLEQPNKGNSNDAPQPICVLCFKSTGLK